MIVVVLNASSGLASRPRLREQLEALWQQAGIEAHIHDAHEPRAIPVIARQALDAQGFDVDIQTVGGFRDLLFGAFDSGDVNLAPDYVASELEFLNENAGEATGDVDETFDLLQPRLEERDLVGLTPSDAVDTNAFVVTQETADDLGLTSLSDLAEKGADLTLGAPQDCETNPFCIPGLQNVYGLDMSSNFTPLDAGVVLTSLQEGAVDVVLLFSTDGRIAALDLVLLEDERHAIPPYDAVILAGARLAREHPEAVAALRALAGTIDADRMRRMNLAVDQDGKSPEAVAEEFLQGQRSSVNGPR